ncbi:MAG: peptidoglycan editing factor PgeF [Burkholderiales bacterium]
MPESPADWIVPEWPAPPGVRALITTRHGGVSRGTYQSMNLGMRVNDDPEAVRRNRDLLRGFLPGDPRWLAQVHGTRSVEADSVTAPVEADAAFTRSSAVVCAVMIADCLPVLLCDREATVVAAAHAGWRGLSAGVIESAVAATGIAPGRLLAYLGPAIGPEAFEVGADVFNAFVSRDRAAAQAFKAKAPGKWLCDLFSLARQRLDALGVASIFGGGLCTYSDPARFFSHRRDRTSGRMTALIWREGSAPHRA